MTYRTTNQITNVAAADSLPHKPEPRLGLINYINSLPIVQPIIDGQIKIAALTVFAQPAELNALYANQKLDLGAMSAFSYLQQGTLKLMPGISIASRGAVGSVLFFAKSNVGSQPLRIAVPLASATAINLLLVLLLEQGHQKPVIIPSQQPHLFDQNIDAALVIGDHALAVDSLWSKQFARRDLGQWWYELFSLPAVFGIFAARQEWHNDANSQTFKTINASLIESAQFGLTEYFDIVLAKAQEKISLSSDRLSKYFKEELDYSFDCEHQQSLIKYEALCRHHGLL